MDFFVGSVFSQNLQKMKWVRVRGKFNSCVSFPSPVHPCHKKRDEHLLAWFTDWVTKRYSGFMQCRRKRRRKDADEDDRFDGDHRLEHNKKRWTIYLNLLAGLHGSQQGIDPFRVRKRKYTRNPCLIVFLFLFHLFLSLHSSSSRDVCLSGQNLFLYPSQCTASVSSVYVLFSGCFQLLIPCVLLKKEKWSEKKKTMPDSFSFSLWSSSFFLSLSFSLSLCWWCRYWYEMASSFTFTSSGCSSLSCYTSCVCCVAPFTSFDSKTTAVWKL